MKNLQAVKMLRLCFVWLLPLGCLSPVFAMDSLFPETVDYRATQSYAGRFDRLNLYWSYDQQGPFRPSRGPELLDNVTCPPARDALRAKGYWVGTLEETGGCGLEGDPKVWILGNFINFLGSPPAERQDR